MIPPLCGLFKEVAEPDTQGALLSVPFQEDWWQAAAWIWQKLNGRSGTESTGHVCSDYILLQKKFRGQADCVPAACCTKLTVFPALCSAISLWCLRLALQVHCHSVEPSQNLIIKINSLSALTAHLCSSYYSMEITVANADFTEMVQIYSISH